MAAHPAQAVDVSEIPSVCSILLNAARLGGCRSPKNRSHRFSGCTTHATSQSSSSISGSSQRSTSRQLRNENLLAQFLQDFADCQRPLLAGQLELLQKRHPDNARDAP